MPSAETLFYIDNLSLIMMTLVGFVSLNIAVFSSRYLRGDRKQGRFYLNLAALVAAIFIMVSAAHLLLLLISWALSNYLLTRLMLHKREWEAARQSSILALKNFAFGSVLLASALLILYLATGETRIQTILSQPIQTPWVIASSVFLLLAAMTQSALWPFHRWLTSSLNSPTPVSAIMHAGLVNGGGFLLARFMPILSSHHAILHLIFITGMTTAILGTIWKLMQSDVKRMLACSTMGQMGFMIAQCGLGLFPAAIAHLCWHGLFKAYLFLASGSAAQEKRLNLSYPPSLKHFAIALVCGIAGAYLFALTSEKDIFAADTSIFLVFLAMVAGTQFSLPIIKGHSIIKIPLSLTLSLCAGALYGLSVFFIEQALVPLNLFAAQPFNLLHAIGLGILSGGWLALLFTHRSRFAHYPRWALKAYVYLLNGSQPHPKTITAHRYHYKF